MSIDEGEPEIWLFSYGTLRQPEVQRALFGRLLEGRADILPEHSLSMIEITDPDVVATSGATHHPIVRRTGNAADAVEGMALRITRRELEQADAYEVAEYRRVAVTLASGLGAFVYIQSENPWPRVCRAQ